MLNMISRIAQIITNIGIKNAEGENYKSAIENFTNAINLYPLEIALYEWRAKCYMFSGQYDLAHNDYIKITLLTGNTPEEILKPIGLCCMMNGKNIIIDQIQFILFNFSFQMIPLAWIWLF